MPTKYLTRTLALSSTLAFAVASGAALAQQQDQAPDQPSNQLEQQESSQQSMGGGEAGGSASIDSADSDTPPPAGGGEAGGVDSADSGSTTTVVGGEEAETDTPPAGGGAAGGSAAIDSDPATSADAQPSEQAAAAGIEPVLDEEQLLELQGQTVVNAQGEEIGQIDSIVRDRADQSLKAVITSGGFLGMGGEKFAVAADELEVQEDQVLLNTPMSEEELQQAAASYDEQAYEPLGDTAVGGGEAGGASEEPQPMTDSQ